LPPVVARLRSWPLAPASSRLGEHRVALADPPVGRDLAVGGRRAQQEAAVVEVGDLAGGERAHVHDEVRSGHAELEVVDQVGAAAEEDGVRLGGDVAHGLGDAARTGVVERLHAGAPPACCTAGVMFA
jgi:hypothetical protein